MMKDTKVDGDAVPTELVDMSVVDGVGEGCSPDCPRLYIDAVAESSHRASSLLLQGWRVQHFLHAESFKEEASRDEVQDDFLLRVLVRVDMVSRVDPGSSEGSWRGILIIEIFLVFKEEINLSHLRC